MARIGILTVSDRASAGIYRDESGPAIAEVLGNILVTPFEAVARIVPDGVESVRDAIIALVDEEGCDLVLTTGGTGPAPRDLTPEGTQAACEKMMPGFGEVMRRVSLEQVPTAMLSRQTAGIRGRALVVNLPGKPSSIRISLLAIFPAIPYCLDLVGAAYLETDPEVISAFRPAQGAPAEER
jgi:molybdopterin adenylyltransferase